MKQSALALPSNRKFGGFFCSVFLIAAAYSFLENAYIFAIIFITVSVFLALVTLVDADKLLPLNKAWSWLGVVLSRLANPIILASIFYAIFVPVGAAMRWTGRDELRLRKRGPSYWIARPSAMATVDFTRQF